MYTNLPNLNQDREGGWFYQCYSPPGFFTEHGKHSVVLNILLYFVSYTGLLQAKDWLSDVLRIMERSLTLPLPLLVSFFDLAAGHPFS